MELHETNLPGVWVIEPRVFEDARGFFMETYQQNRYVEAGITPRFVQDNYSHSQRGTLRGLHFQIQHPQAKLVQVLRGEIFDVAVDLRRDSPHFGRWTGVTLSETNHRQIYVPRGFAHGFCVLSNVAEVFYKCADLYDPEHERTLLWNDPDVGVEWPLETDPLVSEKDSRGIRFAELECYDASPK